MIFALRPPRKGRVDKGLPGHDGRPSILAPGAASWNTLPQPVLDYTAGLCSLSQEGAAAASVFHSGSGRLLDSVIL
jgi:hypothetical protein